MAEDNLEQKKWPYILRRVLAFVVIAVLLWVGLEIIKSGKKTGRDETPGKTVVVPTTVVTVPAQVSEFAGFIEDHSAGETMELEHDYTSDGIRRLADALGAIADQQEIKDPDIEDKLDLLRGHADRIQEDRRSTEHADTVLAAFTLASDLIASIERQTSRNRKDEVAEVRQAAEAIDPDKLVLDQKAEVEAFFKRTSRLLNEMAQHRG